MSGLAVFGRSAARAYVYWKDHYLLSVDGTGQFVSSDRAARRGRGFQATIRW
jgi:hypothetical protein